MTYIDPKPSVMGLLGGLAYCALATTAVYALILPVLLLIPGELTGTADGERNLMIEPEVLAGNPRSRCLTLP